MDAWLDQRLYDAMCEYVEKKGYQTVRSLEYPALKGTPFLAYFKAFTLKT